MDLEKYRRLFVEEATEHLADMSRALVALEQERSAEETTEAVDTLFRMAHSIKGMAASLDYETVATLAHGLEDWIEPLRNGAFPSAALGLLYESLAALEAMVAEVAETGVSPQPRSDLTEHLSRPPQAEGPLPRSPRRAPRAARAVPPLPDSVRVRAASVDRVLASVGEIVQRQARLDALHRCVPFWKDRPEFREELACMDDSVRELRRRALDMRTTPVRRILERLPRVAGELARELGKRVRVDLAGDEIEVDRAVLDHLDGPLLHLVRNAVDHGIETPEARRAAGKPEIGVISVRAEGSGGRVRVCLSDDGGGIDAEAVRREAVERGLLLDAVAEDLPLERVCELIFEPGMTTSDEVTEVSGRGVGMDAVKRTIEGLGGTLSVQTEPGVGTTFAMDLPSMVALQRVLVLGTGDQYVALPVSQVECVVAADEGSIEGVGDEAFFVWRDEPLPLLDLPRRFGFECGDSVKGGSVVVVEARGFRLGLRVDRAIEDLEVFVREVPEALTHLKSLGGVAILPDGVPVFLLEVGALVEEAA